MLTQIYVAIKPSVGPNELALWSEQNSRHFPEDSTNSLPLAPFTNMFEL